MSITIDKALELNLWLSQDNEMQFELDTGTVTLPVFKNGLYKVSFSKKIPIVATYVIIDSIEGWAYVGSSRDVGKRLRAHRTNLNRGVAENSSLQHIFDMRVKIQMDVLIITCHDREQAFDIEQILIEWLDGEGRLLNHSKDSRRNGFGVLMSEENKNKFRERMTGRVKSKEERLKLSRSRKGFRYSDESKRKMVASAKIRANSPEGKARLTALNSTRKKPVYIEGTTYSSMAEAARSLDLNLSMVQYRISSPHQPEWRFTDAAV